MNIKMRVLTRAGFFLHPFFCYFHTRRIPKPQWIGPYINRENVGMRMFELACKAVSRSGSFLAREDRRTP